jgi:small subunit ribosomal protein S16
MPKVSDVRIRLARLGRKHRAVYRIVVAHHYAPRDGKFIEHIGTYDPHPDRVSAKHVRLNVGRFQHWIGKGAHPSDTVARIASKFNLLPPQPIRVDMPLSAVKPELVPRPVAPLTPTLNVNAERYYSTAASLTDIISGAGYTLVSAKRGSFAGARRGLLF